MKENIINLMKSKIIRNDKLYFVDYISECNGETFEFYDIKYKLDNKHEDGTESISVFRVGFDLEKSNRILTKRAAYALVKYSVEEFPEIKEVSDLVGKLGKLDPKYNTRCSDYKTAMYLL